MSPRMATAGAILMTTAALSACGGGDSGGGGPGQRPLSAAQYRARLASVAQRVNAAQSAIQHGIRAKTVADLRVALVRFADDQRSIGNAVSALEPPANAASANALLARGFRDSAAELRSVIGRLSGARSPQAAMAILARSPPRGGREIDRALTALRKRGYTKGS